MMNIWFALAGIGTFCVCLTHVIVGGRFVIRPILATREIDTISKYTSWYGWHLVTLTLAAMAIMYLLAATNAKYNLLAWSATLLAIAFFLFSLSMIVTRRLKFLHFPQWLFFALIAALGLAGLGLG